MRQLKGILIGFVATVVVGFALFTWFQKPVSEVLGGRTISKSNIFNTVNYTWPSAGGDNGEALVTNASDSLNWTNRVTGTKVRIATASNVNFKTVNTTTLFDVSAALSGGEKVVLTDLIIRPSTSTAASGNAAYKMGSNAAVSNIISAETLTVTTTVSFKHSLFPSSTVSTVFTSTSADVLFKVTSGDGGTGIMATLDLYGFYLAE